MSVVSLHVSTELCSVLATPSGADVIETFEKLTA